MKASSNGTAQIIYAFQGSGVASNYSCSFTLPVTVYEVKIEVTSPWTGISPNWWFTSPRIFTIADP